MGDPESDSEGRPRTSSANQSAEDATVDAYDFENFTPRDMAAMDLDDWEAHFDPDTWITGPALLDRVEADLKNRVANRELFAVVERTRHDEVLAYSDEGYALVHPDGTLEGDGVIYQEIEPIIALCAMDSYDPPSMPPDDALLPDPDAISSGSGGLGNRLIELLALVQVLAGLFLLASPFLFATTASGSFFLVAVTGLGFITIGVVLFFLVANARLSDRFRAKEYRDRLRSIGVGTDHRPEFLPPSTEQDESE